MDERDGLSRGRIDRAGDVLRRHRLGESVEAAALADALGVLARYRSRWDDRSSPLQGVAQDLHDAARSACGPDVEVTQRLKREDRIIDKLVRLPALPLSRVQDIGGCRAVVPTLRHARSLLEAVRGGPSMVRRVNDYVADPKPDGYRAVHVVVERDSCLVEIQLRTRLQHAWARIVEKLEARLGHAVRAGSGEPELQLALRHLAESMAEMEPADPSSGGRVSDRDDAFIDRAQAALSAVEQAC